MEVVSDRTKPTVKDYMTRDVATVSPDETVGQVATRIAESEQHSGFPVCDRRRVEASSAPATCCSPRTTTRFSKSWRRNCSSHIPT